MTQADPSSARRRPRLLGLATPARIALIPPISAARWIILLIVLISIYFFHGFLVPVLAALIIGFASWPLYRHVIALAQGNRTLSASIMIAAIVLFLVVPALFIGSYAIQEMRMLFQWGLTTNSQGAPAPDWFATLPLGADWLTGLWDERIGRPGALGELVEGAVGANILNIYHSILSISGGTLNFLLNLLFAIVALLFVYRDGERLAAQLDKIGQRIFPLRWDRLSRIIPATISSTVTGMTIIAIGEGIVLGIAYWMAGAPSPVLLGIITGVAAMIPGGAPLSFTLVSAYLVASGSPFQGLALLTWGSVELFIVDKTLRPKLVGGPIKLPFLPTFFGLIGGVKTMGFVGLFIGPVLMALLVSMWREWMLDLEEPEGTALLVEAEAGKEELAQNANTRQPAAG
jgi:predicted PurR-regulated permease PerM